MHHTQVLNRNPGDRQNAYSPRRTSPEIKSPNQRCLKLCRTHSAALDLRAAGLRVPRGVNLPPAPQGQALKVPQGVGLYRYYAYI